MRKKKSTSSSRCFDDGGSGLACVRSKYVNIKHISDLSKKNESYKYR